LQDRLMQGLHSMSASMTNSNTAVG
jgi:hypothetical protein